MEEFEEEENRILQASSRNSSLSTCTESSLGLISDLEERPLGVSGNKIGHRAMVEGVDYEALPPTSMVNNNPTAWERSKQNVAVWIWFSMLIGFLSAPSFLFLYCAFFVPSSRLILLAYVAWMIYDRNSAVTGWKPNAFRKFVRENSLWRHFQSYFPGQLIKTHHLDPKRKYIMGWHPHGVYAISMFANVVFNKDFKLFFPGIEALTVTLPANFFFPLWRDYALVLGTGTCTSQSINYRLKHGDPGTSLIIVVGGAEEFKYMNEGTLDLVLAKRKGFVKIALKGGYSLVPILGFGENEIFTRITHPFFQPLHRIFKALIKSSAPLFVGKYNSPFPKRFPLVTVVGKPIYLDPIPNPTQDEIDSLHERYMNELQNLYDDYKDVFHSYRTKDMTFV